MSDGRAGRGDGPGTGDDACATVELTAADGATVRFCAHGGHVLGWTPSGGRERLWLSRSTGCGPGTAIRGGVPVVWPQFAERGDGPRHGVARDRAWEVRRAGTDADGAAEARLQLVSDGTDTPFPHPFTLDLSVVARGATLVMTLTATNDGDEPFGFTAALHTYLRVSSTSDATVRGLDGLTALPNDGGDAWPVRDPLAVVGPVDVAVDMPVVVGALGGGGAGSQGGAGPAREVVLDDPVLGRLTLTASSFGSRVVWNPGPGQAPADVHPGGEAEFVCVEPAQLHPVTLAPGGSWSGTQTLVASAPPG